MARTPFKIETLTDPKKGAVAFFWESGKLKENERKRKDHDMQNGKTGMNMTGPRTGKRAYKKRKLKGTLKIHARRTCTFKDKKGTLHQKSKRMKGTQDWHARRKTAI